MAFQGNVGTRLSCRRLRNIAGEMPVARILWGTKARVAGWDADYQSFIAMSHTIVRLTQIASAAQ
jgi:hypothetical protein